MGLAIALWLWAVLSFCSATIGGPPEDLQFSNRRSYTEIKRATHAAFFPFVVRVIAGVAVLLGGSRLLRGEPDDA